jgi:hypothetical protein
MRKKLYLWVHSHGNGMKVWAYNKRDLQIKSGLAKLQIQSFYIPILWRYADMPLSSALPVEKCYD